LKILVFIKVIVDTKVPLEYSHNTGRLLRDWNVTQLNPPDRKAIDTALKIKREFPDTRITLIHLGPTPEERWAHEGLALGVDEGLRIWEEDIEGCSVNAKAFIFARTAQILGFDLILAGNKSEDTMSGQLGILLASYLNLPVINAVTDIRINERKGKIIALKNLSKGYRERIECPLPLVITTDASDSLENYASFAALLEAYEKEIPCWDLAQIGIPIQSIHEKNALLTFESLRFPKPRLKTIPAPDSTLPAFERIKQLIEGTIKPREGKIVKKDEDSIVEELFQILRKEGWLDHLKKSPLQQ
jgi:electron transfer flavoprotein beta subunit